MVEAGASKTALRKRVCFNFMKNGCTSASCEKLHSGEPGSLRATILARLEGKSGQVAWDAKRPPSEAAAKLRKKQKKSKVPEPGIECQLYVKGISGSSSDQAIAQEFQAYGKIHCVKHKEGQNFAFVVFTTADAVAEAVDLGYSGKRLLPKEGETSREFTGITVEARVLHRTSKSR